jgi:hypothetical protein
MRTEPIGINCQAKGRVNKLVAKTAQEATLAWLRVPQAKDGVTWEVL